MSLLDRLTGRARREPPPWEGVEGPIHEGSALEAILAAETSFAECLVLGRGIPGDPGGTLRADSTADAISLAAACSLAGLRVTAFGLVGEGTAERLRSALRLRAPLVAHLLVREEQDLASLRTAAVPLAVARDGEHALDLALVARRLAESALTPVVVALEEPSVARARNEWRLPSDGLVREFLGAAGDDDPPVTPAQRILFGETRRRVPRWFDPDRPVLTGAEMPDDLRAPAQSARECFFDAALSDLLAAARERFASLTGRDVPSFLPTREAAAEASPASEPVRSTFPRREALLQRVRREYPEAARLEVPSGTLPPSPPSGDRADEVPLAVRRLGRVGGTYDNVARFWGETAEPWLGGDPAARAVDPFLALGAVPSYASTLFAVAPTEDRLPLLDPERCTGCGACWSACPDASVLGTAVPFAALLESAAKRAAAATESAAASMSRLKRTFKGLASRLESSVSRGEGPRRLDAARLEEAWKGLAEEGLGEAFSATVAEVRDLPLLAAPRLGGTPLLLAFDPRTCRGCGICAAECPEDAIRLVPRSPEVLDAARRAIDFWEDLPDTPGTIVERAARDPEVGPLAAALLTRHAAFAVGGGGEGRAGSGTRLAARQVLSVLEAERQLVVSSRLDDLATLEEKLRGAIREELARAAVPEDLAAFEAALAPLSSRQAPVAELLARLEAVGERHAVDGDRLRRLARAAREIADLRRAVLEGSEGVARARFGIVVVSGGLDWATRFPANPFGAPAVVTSPESAAATAIGLAHALVARAVEEARSVRGAALALEAPADFEARLSALDDLGWTDLTDGEAAACLPVVLLAAESGLPVAAAAAMLRALDTGLPIRGVLLHDGEAPPEDGDSIPVAVPRAGAPVGWATPGEGARLAESVTASARTRGPSLLRVSAPEPLGISPDATVALARDPARCRALARWASLEGPVADRIREEARREADREREAEIAAVRSACEKETAEAGRARATTDAAWLRRRLLELAGFGDGRTP